MRGRPEVAALFRRLSAGVHVIGTAHGERRDAFTAAWLMQVSFDPLLVALSVNPSHASYPLLRGGGGFTVSVLRGEQQEAARHFGTTSGRDVDKLAGRRWRPGRGGAPILTDALAWLECDLAGAMPAGDHEVVLGKVTAGGLLAPDAAPLLYADTGDMDGSLALYPDTLAP
jgi:flavin reductase (DIM6/NTAB) family NADH-FMN oxidoreductase RutF